MTPLHVALALASLCGVAAWQVSLIPESIMQMTVGPTLVPAVVVAGLALLALIYGISAWRGHQADESLSEGQSALPGANQRLLSLLAGGLAFIVLIASTFWLLFARILGVGLGPALPMGF